MSIQAFDQAMFEAVEAARVGFYFEEGGCWGMAKALHDRLIEAGMEAEIRYKPTGFVHCWAEAHGIAFDYRGAMSEVPAFGLTLDEEWFAAIAAHYGTDRSALEADVALAKRIVDAAFLVAPLRVEDEGTTAS